MSSSRFPPDIDTDKLAEAAIALLSLTLHDHGRVWKSLDWWPSQDRRPREKTEGIRELTELASRDPRRSSQRDPATGLRIRDGIASTHVRTRIQTRLNAAHCALRLIDVHFRF
jgi:hypothetical protein